MPRTRQVIVTISTVVRKYERRQKSVTVDDRNHVARTQAERDCVRVNARRNNVAQAHVVEINNVVVARKSRVVAVVLAIEKCIVATAAAD